MKPYDYQEEMARDALEILLEHHLVYLACEERTGKTLASIRCAEQHPAKSVLVITKKKALKGWLDTLAKYKTNKPFEVTTYHQASKVTKEQRELIIIDEAHSYISSIPKPGVIWTDLKPLCRQADIIYISATPHAQGPQQLYHQFKLSSFSPWAKYPNYYSWHKTFGKPYTVQIKGIDVPKYDRCYDELVFGTVNHLFITKTRAELDFEHEPEDELHWLTLGEAARAVYNTLLEHKVVQLKAGLLTCETVAKLRMALHMLEGGVAKIGNTYITLANREKIDYIKRTWGDTAKLAIMYQYQEEGRKLRAEFQHAEILQGDSYAEGVDLMHIEHLVIYSQSFSTAKHTQRRARQANKNRKTKIVVHFLLVRKAISHQVYKTVSLNKVNYVDSRFERLEL